MEPFKPENSIDQLFSNAFFEKEMAPEPHVWANIREGAAIQPSRKGWLLSAAMLSAVGVASFLFYSEISYNNVTRNSIVQKEAPNSSIPERVLADKREENEENKENKMTQEDQPPLLAMDDNQEPMEDTPSQLIDRSHNAMTENRVRNDDAGIVIDQQTWDLGNDETLMTLSMAPFWKKMPNKSASTSYWAQAGFGAGSSSTLEGLSSSLDVSSAEAFLDGSSTQSIETTSELAGTSFSSGISAGMRLGRKWIAEAGLAFNISTLQGTTNALESTSGYELPVYFQPRFDGDVVFVSPFTISSNLQFLSLPVRIGYRIIDRKVGWLVTSGVASNFLVKQSVTSGAYDNFNIPRESSPFRKMYVSGTVGTEVYVGLASYQLGVNSQFGTAISNLSKPDAPFDLQPSFWQIGLNIRYIFK